LKREVKAGQGGIRDVPRCPFHQNAQGGSALGKSARNQGKGQEKRNQEGRVSNQIAGKSTTRPIVKPITYVFGVQRLRARVGRGWAKNILKWGSIDKGRVSLREGGEKPKNGLKRETSFPLIDHREGKDAKFEGWRN